LSSGLRNRLAPGDGILVGSVGRLDEQKGYDVLIRAARLVVDEQPNVYFAIAGQGPLRAILSRLITDLGLNANVQLCGFRQDVENFLYALDLFVCSSNWEGLPLALLEAMMLEKPVVATDVGGNAEVVQPGVTGELVPKGDPAALAESILAAIRNRTRLVDGTREARPDLASATDPRLTAMAFDEVLRVQLSQAHHDNTLSW
jgi:glycosyltransferase involved in cell wall biosynthesis